MIGFEIILQYRDELSGNLIEKRRIIVSELGFIGFFGLRGLRIRKTIQEIV